MTVAAKQPIYGVMAVRTGGSYEYHGDTIGALSERTEVNIETIRYYERIAILPKPPRSAGGHRLYAEEYQCRLVFVRRARELGFSLDDVRASSAHGGRHMACGKAKRITEKHIADIHRVAAGPDARRQNGSIWRASGCPRGRHLGLPNP